MNIAFGARCLTCDQVYDQILTDPGSSKRNGQILNRRIWMDVHRDQTGHYRFAVSETKSDEISVAVVPRDPAQLLLSDDPNYATFTLGENP